jgi:hypothetical protein
VPLGAHIAGFDTELVERQIGGLDSGNGHQAELTPFPSEAVTAATARSLRGPSRRRDETP